MVDMLYHLSKRVLSAYSLLILASLLFTPWAHAGSVGAKEPADDDTAVSNVVTRIETTEDGIEVELTSSKPFPVRALPPILRVGSSEFRLSRNPEDGRLETLIFLVPEKDFAELRADDAVAVFYGSPAPVDEGTTAAIAEPGGYVWDFGAFPIDLLDKSSRN
jgi:hypothetical protein